MGRQYLLASTILSALIVAAGPSYSSADSTEQNDTPSVVESAMWEYALSTGKAQEISRFLDVFPDSVFRDTAEQIEATLSDDDVAQSTLSAEPDGPISSVKVVTFNQALDNDPSSGNPRSIKQLSEGSPQFAPVDDLPAQLWEEKNCSDCHTWEKENLCIEAKFFADRDQEAIQRIKHPYGGFYKQALAYWAAGGCQ